MAEAREYPYDRWPRVSRGEALRLRTNARSGPLAALARGAAQASKWLGARLVLTPLTAPERASLPVAIDPIVAIGLEDTHGTRSVLVLDVPIAAVFLDRVVGGTGAGLEAAMGPLGTMERGMLAYAWARWLAGARSTFTVATVLSSSAAAIELLGPEPHERTLVDLRVGEARGRMACWMPAGARLVEGVTSLPAWAGVVPIEVAIRAAAFTLPAGELAALEPGDIVVPERTELRMDAGALDGLVNLESTDGALSLRAELCEGGLRIAESEMVESEPRRGVAGGAKEVDVNDADRVLEKLGSTPVTLSLELARFSLPLDELARMAPGEVIRTGVTIGERAALRAGDRVIAMGELVDVDGEIGLRVLELPRA